MKIRETLNKIQIELHAPKNQYNSFGKYKYRSCEDILEGIKPLLKETETTLVVVDMIVLIGERYYIKATATLCDLEGSFVSADAFAREPLVQKGMNEAQITGSASSYARKYALNGLFCIDDNKDADATNQHGKDSEKLVDKKELNVIRDGLISIEANEEKFCSFLKVDKLENLPKTQYQQAIAAIEASKKKKESK